MFEDIFTIYNMVKPPEEHIKDFNNMSLDIDIPEIAEHTYNIPSTSENYNDAARMQEDFSYLLSPIKKKEKDLEHKKLQGSKQFEEAFKKAVALNPEVEKYRNFLVRTAKRESGFNSYIQNRAGAPYYGYFQMGQQEIKKTTGLSVEEFRNNPVQQILGAVKLYKMNLKTMKALKIYDIGKAKGYSDDTLVAGAWMGGPGGVKTYLLGKGDPSDSHWYKGGKGGSSVGKIMNDWMRNK